MPDLAGGSGDRAEAATTSGDCATPVSVSTLRLETVCWPRHTSLQAGERTGMSMQSDTHYFFPFLLRSLAACTVHRA